MGIFMMFAVAFIGGVFYEFYGARNFVERLYFLGLKLINFNENWGDIHFHSSSEPKETASGKFKVINSTTVLFRHTQPIFSMQVHTPFPFKGVIELKDGYAHISARIPVIQAIVIGIWLTAWTAGGLGITIFGEGNRLIGLFFLLGGWGFLGAMLGYGYVLEKKRLLMVLEEIKSSLGVSGSSLQSRKDEGIISFEWKNTIIFALVIVTLVFGSHHLIFSSALKKITESKDPQKLRLEDFESAFALDKNIEEKEKLRKQYQLACDTQNDYNCRLLGYIHELNKDVSGAFRLYVRSCSDKDPHGCYNIISSREHAAKEDISKAKSILEPLCIGPNRDNFKICCDCYDKEKKKGNL